MILFCMLVAPLAESLGFTKNCWRAESTNIGPAQYWHELTAGVGGEGGLPLHIISLYGPTPDNNALLYTGKKKTFINHRTSADRDVKVRL